MTYYVPSWFEGELPPGYARNVSYVSKEIAMASCGAGHRDLTFKYHGKTEKGEHWYQILCRACNYEGPSFRNQSSSKAEADCAGQLRVLQGVSAVKTYAGWGSNRRARRGRQAARASREQARANAKA